MQPAADLLDADAGTEDREVRISFILLVLSVIFAVVGLGQIFSSLKWGIPISGAVGWICLVGYALCGLAAIFYGIFSIEKGNTR